MTPVSSSTAADNPQPAHPVEFSHAAVESRTVRQEPPSTPVPCFQPPRTPTRA